MKEYLTNCCNARYGVGGEGTTHWYMCTNCGKPTHIPGTVELTDEEMNALLLQSEHAIG
jgi:hypothetical protein